MGALRASLVDVGATAVQANADSEKFPAGWLFHHRWRNQTSGTFSSPIGVIKFDTVGGRTTAWLPSAQKAGEAGKKAAAAAKAARREDEARQAREEGGCGAHAGAEERAGEVGTLLFSGPSPLFELAPPPGKSSARTATTACGGA